MNKDTYEKIVGLLDKLERCENLLNDDFAGETAYFDLAKDCYGWLVTVPEGSPPAVPDTSAWNGQDARRRIEAFVHHAAFQLAKETRSILPVPQEKGGLVARLRESIYLLSRTATFVAQMRDIHGYESEIPGHLRTDALLRSLSSDIRAAIAALSSGTSVERDWAVAKVRAWNVCKQFENWEMMPTGTRKEEVAQQGEIVRRAVRALRASLPDEPATSVCTACRQVGSGHCAHPEDCGQIPEPAKPEPIEDVGEPTAFEKEYGEIAGLLRNRASAYSMSPTLTNDFRYAAYPDEDSPDMGWDAVLDRNAAHEIESLRSQREAHEGALRKGVELVECYVLPRHLSEETRTVVKEWIAEAKGGTA